MPVRFFYVDESHDAEKFCLSAISLRHSTWQEAFREIRAHRLHLRETHGIFLRTPRVEKYGIHEMFEAALKGVCFLPASPRDPSKLGIVRR